MQPGIKETDTPKLMVTLVLCMVLRALLQPCRETEVQGFKDHVCAAPTSYKQACLPDQWPHSKPLLLSPA